MRISRLFVPQPLVIGCPAPVGKALARYVQRVLRLRNGDEVVIFDGSGAEYAARLCEPCAFPAWLRDRTEADAELIFSPSAEQPLTPGRSATSVRILIGPEGGFSESEVAAATDAGFEPMRLGPRILRAETAATMAVGAVQLLWGDLSQHRQTDH